MSTVLRAPPMPSANRYAGPQPHLADLDRLADQILERHSSPGSLRDAVYRPTRAERLAEKQRHAAELREERQAAPTIERLEQQLAAGEITLEEMGRQLRICCPTSYRLGRTPTQATHVEPGSGEKIVILRDRIARGETCSHPDDATLGIASPWHCPGTPMED